MNITPVYELRDQLRTAAIAGTSLLSENFRLQKAADNFSEISAASPVFVKIKQQLDLLMKEKTPRALMDTLTLVDSVITVLAANGTTEEISPVKASEGSIAENAPYSRLSALISALTSVGSGNHRIVSDFWETDKNIFRDFRVMPALISALGASYGELAELAAEILIQTGGEAIVPLLKKDFDPKGKKDMVRRVKMIEKICGAKENDFYLSQLENAQKDVRRALIFALGHDESNTEKLAGLVKTEKIKNRKAALYVLGHFGNDKAHEIFTEYAYKKPCDVLDVLEALRSPRVFDVTAEVIGKILTDESGKITTISEIKNNGSIKITAEEIANALLCKKGAAVERIYREYTGVKIAETLSNVLGRSVIMTQDPELMKLAVELNSSDEFKGKYMYAEAAARIFGSEDCSEWVASDKTNTYYANILLSKTALRDGRFIYSDRYYYSVTEESCLIEVPVEQPIKEKITDILINSGQDLAAETLERWIDPSDSVYSQKLGKYFVERFVNNDRGYFANLDDAGRCGVYNVKGLVCRHFECKHYKSSHRVSSYDLEWLFNKLPGDNSYKVAEAESLIDAVKKGKLKLEFDMERFESYIEKLRSN